MAEVRRPGSVGDDSPLVAVAPSVRTAAGAPASLSVTITNRAHEPRQFEVLAGGVDPSWLPVPEGATPPGVRVPERTPQLAPGETTVVTLTVSPPPGTHPARYPLVVTVRPLAAVGAASRRRAAGPVVVAESVLVVNPRAHLTLEMEPSRTSLVRSRRITVTVGNAGTEAARVSLSAPPSPGLEVRLRRREVDVPPGGSVPVRGRLVAARPRRLGSVVDHSWAVTAATPEVVRHARGVARQRPLFGGSVVKVVALVLVLAVWVGGAWAGIPKLVETIDKQQADTAETASAPGEDGAGDAAGDAGGSDGGDASGDGGGDAAAADSNRILLSGTIVADDPSGFAVNVRSTTLFGADAVGAEGGTGADDGSGDTLTDAAYGMVSSSYVASEAAATAGRRTDFGTVTSTKDGAWAVERIPVRGYYVIEVSKPGFATRTFFVDPTDEKAGEPREITMTPARGTVSGRVTGIGPGGGSARPVGAATITVSDGTNVLSSTTDAAGGREGRWRIGGLDAPGTYVVTASAPGFGTSAKVVRLGADGDTRVGLVLTQGRFALSGTVLGPPITGGELPSGLAGATVTVEDGQGVVRSTTTVSERDGDRNPGRLGSTGAFVVDDIPVPGTYTVTVSAAGFQSSRQKLVLTGASRDFTFDGSPVPSGGAEIVVTRATGMVTGTVKLTRAGETHLREVSGGAAEDVRGTGLTLTNDTGSYRIQVAGSSGEFAFFGVAPGVYQLVGNLYDLHVGVQTVEVTAGRTDRAGNLRLDVDGSATGGGSSSAHVFFDVVEANVGEPVTCPDPAVEDCITASLTGEDVGGTGAFKTTLTPDGQGTLPTEGGLQPGLYTLTVEVLGYEDLEEKVRVGLGDTDLGTLELFPRPIITGRVTAATGIPGKATCVWAIQVTDATASSPPSAPSACQDGAAGDQDCPDTAARSVADPTTPDPSTCVRIPGGTGDYTLTVPRRGLYWVFATSASQLYRAPAAARISAPIGGTVTHNMVLNRLGEISLRVMQAGGAGALTAAADADVTITAVSGGAVTPTQPGPTGDDGIVVVSGLEPGVYRVHGTKTVAGVPYEGTIETIDVALDQSPVRVLALTDEVTGFVGRVTSNISGSVVRVGGAAVSVTGTTSYVDTTPVPTTATTTTSTDATARGCFKIGAGADVDPCSGLDASVPADVAFTTPTASEITIAADHYDPLTLTNRQLDRIGINSFTLEPSPRSWSTQPVLTTNAAGFDPSVVSVAVTSSVSATGTIAASIDSDGRLVWRDSRFTAGQVKPGTYQVTASYPGFVSRTITVVCGVLPETCGTGDSFVLQKYGTLSVTTQSSAGATGVNTSVSLYKGNTLVSTARPTGGLSTVTFADLVPGGDYNVRVRETGFAYVDGPDDADVAGRLGCSAAAPVNGSIKVESGTPQACTLTLVRLPSVVGRVSGKQGGTTQVALSGATVTISRCAAGGSPCTSMVTSTDAEGRYSFSSSSSFEGFRAGEEWTLSVTQPGYETTDSDRPEPVVVVENGADLTRDLTVTIIPVSFSVDVKDGLGNPVAGATVKLLPSTLPSSQSGGRYTFDAVVPGYYAVSVSADGVLPTTFQVEVRATGAEQVFPAFVSRGQNEVKGTVTSGGAPVAGVSVSLLSCTPAPCKTEPATGTDDVELTMTTGPDGSFLFTTAPDGNYAFRAVRPGYTLDSPTTTYSFVHTTPSSPVPLTLTAATTQATLSYTNPDNPGGDDLTGTTLSVAPVAWGGYSTPPAATGTNPYTLRFGCWQVTAALPAGHFGKVSVTQAGLTEAQEAAAGCGGDQQFLVPAASTPATVQVSVNVAEVPLKVAVTKTPQPSPHPEVEVPPVAATVTITGPGSVDYSRVESLTVGGAAEIVAWLPRPSSGTATYTVTATPAAVNAAFWPAATATATVGPSASASTGVSALPVLVEGTATQQVRIENQTGADYPTTVSVVPDNPGARVAPPSQVVSANGTVTFQLPAGGWTITATPTTGGAVSDHVDIADTSPPVVVLSPTVPPPSGGGDPGGGSGPP